MRADVTLSLHADDEIGVKVHTNRVWVEIGFWANVFTASPEQDEEIAKAFMDAAKFKRDAAHLPEAS